MPRYMVNISIPESEGYVIVFADSEEEATTEAESMCSPVMLTWVNGQVDAHTALLHEDE